MSKLSELMDLLTGLRRRKVIRNSRLCVVVKDNDVIIEIEPNGIGQAPVRIQCKTEEAQRRIEQLLQDIKMPVRNGEN